MWTWYLVPTSDIFLAFEWLLKVFLKYRRQWCCRACNGVMLAVEQHSVQWPWISVQAFKVNWKSRNKSKSDIMWTWAISGGWGHWIEKLQLISCLIDARVLRIRLQSHRVHDRYKIRAKISVGNGVKSHMSYFYVCLHIRINTDESMHSETSPVRQNPIQRTVRTAHLPGKCAYDSAKLQYTIQHRTVLIIFFHRRLPRGPTNWTSQILRDYDYHFSNLFCRSVLQIPYPLWPLGLRRLEPPYPLNLRPQPCLLAPASALAAVFVTWPESDHA